MGGAVGVRLAIGVAKCALVVRPELFSMGNSRWANWDWPLLQKTGQSISKRSDTGTGKAWQKASCYR